LNDLTVLIEGDSLIKVSLLSTGGRLRLKLKQINLGIVFDTFLDSNMKIQLMIESISMSMGDIDIQIEGGIGIRVIN